MWHSSFKEKTMDEYRPFHETVVDEIEDASDVGMMYLASLVAKTKISANHDRIIMALEEALGRQAGEDRDCWIERAIVSLKKQKKEAEAKQRHTWAMDGQ